MRKEINRHKTKQQMQQNVEHTEKLNWRWVGLIVRQRKHENTVVKTGRQSEDQTELRKQQTEAANDRMGDLCPVWDGRAPALRPCVDVEEYIF